MNGKVYLVGAGSGDPGLLTLRGRDILARCDVVVYDRLVNPRLLNHAPLAERVFVGKQPGRVALSQEGINNLLVERGLAGQVVCRLKGGDPFVFGRGGEEALACRAAGVPFEVVPGVTSAIAAAAYAGIPVTHRNVATSFAVITGHENPDKEAPQVDWAGIARGADTLVFLMGIGNLPEISSRLVAEGRAPETPVALVEWGSWPRHRMVKGTLADIVAVAEREGVKPPAVTVVGEVVGLADELAWLNEARPLHGKAVLVTRSRAQASEATERFAALGAEVVEFPVIAIVPRAVGDRLAELLAEGMPFDWLVFTSANAVELFFEALFGAGSDARALAACRVGAVGEATARALAKRGLRADFVPSSFSADDFVAEFPEAASARVLFPCGAKAADTVPRELSARGAKVESLVCYDTVLDRGEVETVAGRFAAGQIDAVTFTSSSTVENFRELLPEVDLTGVCLAAIGPKTAATMRQLGLEPTLIAAESSLDGLVEAVREKLASG